MRFVTLKDNDGIPLSIRADAVIAVGPVTNLAARQHIENMTKARETMTRKDQVKADAEITRTKEALAKDETTPKSIIFCGDQPRFKVYGTPEEIMQLLEAVTVQHPAVSADA